MCVGMSGFGVGRPFGGSEIACPRSDCPIWSPNEVQMDSTQEWTGLLVVSRPFTNAAMTTDHGLTG